MMTHFGLGDLELRILALLNESGSDYVSAIVNAVVSCNGSDQELAEYVLALSELMRRKLIEFASEYDSAAHEWIVLSTESSIAQLKALSSRLAWGESEGMWKWIPMGPVLTVLLTQEGIRLSGQVLRKYGWDMTQARPNEENQ